MRPGQRPGLLLPALHPEPRTTRITSMSTTRCCTKVFVTRFLVAAHHNEKTSRKVVRCTFPMVI
jgi:hypothetical protein